MLTIRSMVCLGTIHQGNLDSLKRYEFGVEVVDEGIESNVDVVRNYPQMELLLRRAFI